MDAYRDEAMEILDGNHYVHIKSSILSSTKEHTLIP